MKKLRMCLSWKRQPNLLLALMSAVSLPLALSSCAMEFGNTEPARGLARPPEPAASLYAGWRVFQDKCARCHSANATGGEGGPDLLPLVQNMSARHFTGLVLKRYDLDQLGTQEALDKNTANTRIDDILQRRDKPMAMPAWQGEPSVNAHIIDIFSYLSARADGKLDAGRPK